MGVINITQRSERLGNIGGTSAAHGVTNTDIGTVRHTSARVFSPTYYSRNSHAGDAAITSGLGKIGDTLTRIGVAVMQREEDRKVDEYTNAMIRTMELESRDDREITDWNTPERQHLRGQKRGYYLRTGKGTMNVAQEWDDCFGERFNQIGTSIEANDRVRERTMKNLATYRRSTLSRLADQQASEYRRLELGNAEGTLTTQVNRFRNGDDSAIPEVFKQYDRVSQLKLLTPEQAQAGKEELALKLAATVIGRQVTGCQTPEDFDRVEADIKSGMKDRLPNEIAANLPGGERAVGGKMKDDLLADVRRARQSFEIKRDREEREALSELVAFSDNALARGGIDDLEAAQRDMAAHAASMPKGSRMETVALQQAKRLDMAADAEAKRLTWDAIIDHAGDKEPWTPPKGSRMETVALQQAKRLDMAADAEAKRLTWDAIIDHAGDKKEWKPDDNTRMAKFYKPLKESFDRQLAAYNAEGVMAQAASVTEERKANMAAMRASMMAAAATEPGTFHAKLADAAEKGHITLDQYRKLRDEFNNVWTKEGMAQKGAALVDILKREFYSGADYDLSERLSVDPKTGRFGYTKIPGGKKGEVYEGEAFELAYGERTIESVPNPYLMSDFTPITPQRWTERKPDTLTSDEQIKLLDWAMELAQNDGAMISTDPQTGEKLDKPRKLNAATEFQAACSQLKMTKRVQSAQEMVQQRATALGLLKAGFAQDADAVVGKATKRAAVEANARGQLKAEKRRPFMPKMPSQQYGTED